MPQTISIRSRTWVSGLIAKETIFALLDPNSTGQQLSTLLRTQRYASTYPAGLASDSWANSERPGSQPLAKITYDGT